MLLAALSCMSPSVSHAYSSPYKPSENDTKPLPDRLYESKTRSTVKLPSGLEYFDLSVGSGDEAQQNSQVWIYYTSRLRGLNGIKLDSSFDEKFPTAFSFRVGDKNVVEGLSEMVVGMQVGGKRRAVLPPNVAYKSAEQRPIVKDFFAKRRLLSVLETSRDSTIVFE
ncbi:Peptidylprolyl isomerase [Gracilaria domingensis]|nr:Peptidylprolyl isomerase [Gracilaria domingensis]